MQDNIQLVNWSTYAQTYDMLLSYNPFYQALHEEVMDIAKEWILPPGAVIADIGAGTGNYSCEFARRYPDAYVLHIDSDSGMCDIARRKKDILELENMKIKNESIDSIFLDDESLDMCTCIHALYTFADPIRVLQQLFDSLKPGGLGIFVDPGRPVRVVDWQLAIGFQMLKQYGLKKTIQVMREGREVSRQNKKLAKMQAEGKLWMHSHEEFCLAVRSVGFHILHSQIAFRGISDLVVVRK